MIYTPSNREMDERAKENLKAPTMIKHISKARLDQIHMFGGGNSKILELEKKYGNYLFVPLALPIFELPENEHFMSWWNSNKEVTKKLDGDIVFDGYGITPFDTVDLITEIGSQWWNNNNKGSSFKQEFPKLWQQFHDQLPCDKLLRLTLWSSRHAIHEHRDTAEYVDLPASYRIKLYDENSEETLYLYDNTLQPYTSGDPYMLPRAPDTNSFVWNNLRCKHGSVFNEGNRKIIAFAFGLTNLNRYEELMDKSISTYSKYCITSNNSIKNYVNI